MDRIPILRMGDFLLVTIQVDMHDQLALQLQDDLTDRIVKTHARGVLIDISALEIVDSGSDVAILDITGVPTVDTLTAQHLLKTVTAARLMGAECIISGIRPQIAQTIVHLGVDLQGVTTKATLADALALAFKRSGLVVSRAQA